MWGGIKRVWRIGKDRLTFIGRVASASAPPKKTQKAANDRNGAIYSSGDEGERESRFFLFITLSLLSGPRQTTATASQADVLLSGRSIPSLTTQNIDGVRPEKKIEIDLNCIVLYGHIKSIFVQLVLTPGYVVIAPHCNHKCANVMNCVNEMGIEWVVLDHQLGNASSLPTRCINMAYQNQCQYVLDVNILKMKFLPILDIDPDSENQQLPPRYVCNSALNWALIRFRRKRKYFVAMQIFAYSTRKGRKGDRRAIKRSREYSLWFNPLVLSR